MPNQEELAFHQFDRFGSGKMELDVSYSSDTWFGPRDVLAVFTRILAPTFLSLSFQMRTKINLIDTSK